MQVFLSYAREDEEETERVYQYLKIKGVDVWMDLHNLTGGDNWDNVIAQEITCSTVFLACVSKSSIKKTGNVQKELKRAVEHQKQKPVDQSYIVPVMLEKCKLPSQLSEYHCIDLTASSGYEEIYRSIQNCFNLQSEYGGGKIKSNSLNYSLYEAFITIPSVNVGRKDFVVTSEFPGVFYRGPDPDDAPYCKEGDSFKKGDPLYIVECAKNFFYFTALEDGILGAFLARNGEFIERDGPIFLYHFEKNRKLK